MARSLSTRKRQWIFFFPVYGLWIETGIGGELKVEDVIFIRADRIPRVRKRLGLNRRVSEYKSSPTMSSLFTGASTYAVVRARKADTKGGSDNGQWAWPEYLRAKEAFWILCSSLLSGYDRSRLARPSMRPPIGGAHVEHFAAFCRSTDEYSISFRLHSPINPVLLDHRWKNDPIAQSFFELLPILNNKKLVTKSWRDSLRRAALLAGQSYLATSPQMAFTNNMIAIECLLTQQGDKFPGSLVQRLSALFGWLHQEDQSVWTETIERLYQLRCSYVHDGKHGDLNGIDLYNADTILSNLILNLSSHCRYIRSKQDLINFVVELEARKVIGAKLRLAKFKWSFPSRALTKRSRLVLNDFDQWAD